MREWAQDLTLRKTLARSNADKSDQVEEWPSLEERSKASASPQESKLQKFGRALFSKISFGPIWTWLWLPTRGSRPSVTDVTIDEPVLRDNIQDTPLPASKKASCLVSCCLLPQVSLMRMLSQPVDVLRHGIS